MKGDLQKAGLPSEERLRGGETTTGAQQSCPEVERMTLLVPHTAPEAGQEWACVVYLEGTRTPPGRMEVTLERETVRKFAFLSYPPQGLPETQPVENYILE